MDIPIWLYVVIGVLVVAFIAFATYWSIGAHKNKVAAGKEDLIGNTAVVEIALEPKGIVLVEGERWNAILNQGRAEPEEEVIITKVDGLKLLVSKK